MTATLPLILCYDSETSSLPAWNAPSDHESQPHLVELAAILATREGEVERFYRKVAIDEWRIEPDAAKAHGVTTEMALADPDRTPEAEAITSFLEFWKRADVRVAHSQSFDERIIRIGCKRFAPDQAEAWSAGKARCTMILAEPLCRLPPTEKMIAAGFGHKFKRPSLEEAHTFLFGEPVPRVDGVHGAMVDAEACLRIYGEIWRKTQS